MEVPTGRAGVIEHCPLSPAVVLGGVGGAGSGIRAAVSIHSDETTNLLSRIAIPKNGTDEVLVPAGGSPAPPPLGAPVPACRLLSSGLGEVQKLQALALAQGLPLVF